MVPETNHNADTVRGWLRRWWENQKRISRHEGPEFYDVCMSDEWNHTNKTCNPGGKYKWYKSCPFEHTDGKE